MSAEIPIANEPPKASNYASYIEDTFAPTSTGSRQFGDETKKYSLKKIKEYIYDLSYLDDVRAATLNAGLGDGGWIKSDGKAIGIEIPFSNIIRVDMDLGEYLLDYPDDFFILADEQFYEQIKDNKSIVGLEPKTYRVRIAMPKSVWPNSPWILAVKEIDSHHINKFIVVEGELKSVTDPKFTIEEQSYHCSLCGEVITVKGSPLGIKNPNGKRKCTCGTKISWELGSVIRVPKMMAVMETSETTSKGTIYHKLKIEFRGDWAKAGLREVIRSGKRMRVCGIYRAVDEQKDGVIKPDPIQYLEANNVEIVDKDMELKKITDTELDSFKKLASTPDVVGLLAEGIYAAVSGYSDIKKALICQIFGGITNLSLLPPTHGQIHILLMGDSGVGKSELLKITQGITPGAMYACGRSTTGVGLTATVLFDEVLGEWTAQAGMLPMAEGSVAIIDEFDKVSKDDKSSLHEALAQYEINVNKASVHAKFSCNTSLLAAANPKLGRFDLYESIYKQFDLPPTLVNRFDVIFPVIDIVNTIKDEAIIDSLSIRHCGKVSFAIDPIIFKKYVVYARGINPKITPEVFNRLKRTYTSIRNKAKTEQGITSVPITPRQVNAIIKFAQASARIKLRDVVQDDDLDFAIDLVTKSLDLITGGKDIDVVETGVSSAKRQNGKIVDMIFKEMYIDAQHKPVDEERLVERIIKECEITYTEAERVVEKKCLEGDWIRPRAGLLIPAFQQTLTEEKL